jgi:hypothetical protein
MELLLEIVCVFLFFISTMLVKIDNTLGEIKELKSKNKEEK